jgi:thiol-disulfide isomerase/thioredoxin
MRNRLVLLSILLMIVTGGFAQRIRKVKVTELERTIAEAKTPLIINFWATFCKPCIEEMPYLLEEVKRHQADSVQLILVSLDLEESYPAKIEAFAAKRKISSTIVWLDEFNADYFCPKIDAAWSGAIPATLFINRKKGYRKLIEEQLSKERLQKEIMAILP